MTIVSFTNRGKIINRKYITSNYLRSTNSIDKLSQGKRIRKTSDSVAENSINSKLVNDVVVLKQSMINSMTYKSKLETAVSGLEQIEKILGDMQRISYKASSYIGTEDDRLKLAGEFEELKNHIDSVVERTRYNGDYLLNSFEIGKGASTYLNDTSIRFLEGADLSTSYFVNKDGVDGNTQRKLINLRTGESEISTQSPDGYFYFPNLHIKMKRGLWTGYNFVVENYIAKKEDNDKFIGIYVTDMTDVNNMLYNFALNHYSTLSLESKDKRSARIVFSEWKVQAENPTNQSHYITTTPEKLHSEYFDFWNQKPLENVKEITLKNPNNSRFKFMKIHIPEVMRNFTRTNGGNSNVQVTDLLKDPTIYRGKDNKIFELSFYGLFLPSKYNLPKEYSISYSVGSKYNERFSINSSRSIDIGLREEGVNLDNEENIKKAITHVKKARGIIMESINKVSVALNRVDFTMSNIDTMMVNTESAISAITDLDVSDELAKLSVLEMQQISATEMISHDIKSKYKLLKI